MTGADAVPALPSRKRGPGRGRGSTPGH